MGRIKTIGHLTSVALVLFGLTGCAGGKDAGYTFEQQPPFSLGKVYFQDWVAGVQGGGSGTNVYIHISSYTDAVEFKDIYFGNKKTKAQIAPQDVDLLVGNFTNKLRPDVIMDGEPVKEAQNTVPEVTPFQLESNEAILSYLYEDEVKYLLIQNLEKKPLLAYPGTGNKGIEEEHE
ncbi:MAG: hypothetical protein AAF466_04350 [Bacteroidota bacterium]